MGRRSGAWIHFSPAQDIRMPTASSKIQQDISIQEGVEKRDKKTLRKEDRFGRLPCLRSKSRRQS